MTVGLSHFLRWLTATHTAFSTLRTWLFDSLASAAGAQLVSAVMTSWVNARRALTRLVSDMAIAETTSGTSQVKRDVMHSSRSFVASSSSALRCRNGWFGRT